jgi:hypothetical protein
VRDSLLAHCCGEAIMKGCRCLGATLLPLFVVLMIGGCAAGQLRPKPPDRPQPESSFRVEFVPAGAEQYPPTDVKEVWWFKIIHSWPGASDSIPRDETPVRPYVKTGELRFGENWYYNSNITELVNTHVPRVGGDAVLVYHAHQTASAMTKSTASGKFENVYYQSIVLEVIRYTDR